jgi:hypothetical protein
LVGNSWELRQQQLNDDFFLFFSRADSCEQLDQHLPDFLQG